MIQNTILCMTVCQGFFLSNKKKCYCCSKHYCSEPDVIWYRVNHLIFRQGLLIDCLVKGTSEALFERFRIVAVTKSTFIRNGHTITAIKRKHQRLLDGIFAL